MNTPTTFYTDKNRLLVDKFSKINRFPPFPFSITFTLLQTKDTYILIISLKELKNILKIKKLKNHLLTKVRIYKKRKYIKEKKLNKKK